jgi:hypothetical protein
MQGDILESDRRSKRLGKDEQVEKGGEHLEPLCAFQDSSPPSPVKMAMGRALEPAGANKTNGSINGVKLTTE